MKLVSSVLFVKWNRANPEHTLHQFRRETGLISNRIVLLLPMSGTENIQDHRLTLRVSNKKKMFPPLVG